MTKKERRNFSMSAWMLAELSVRFRFLLTETLFSKENTWVWACLSFPLTSLWARLFFLFSKKDIFCLKNLHPDFSMEKKTCPTHVSHCRRGEAILGHLCCPSTHSAAARVERTLLMQNTEAAQSPHSVGNAEFHCPEGERKILVLAVAPFSGTWAAAAHSFACTKSCACWACLWDFLSVFGLSRKSRQYKETGNLIRGWQSSRMQGRFAPRLSRLGSIWNIRVT